VPEGISAYKFTWIYLLGQGITTRLFVLLLIYRPVWLSLRLSRKMCTTWALNLHWLVSKLSSFTVCEMIRTSNEGYLYCRVICYRISYISGWTAKLYRETSTESESVERISTNCSSGVHLSTSTKLVFCLSILYSQGLVKPYSENVYFRQNKLEYMAVD